MSKPKTEVKATNQPKEKAELPKTKDVKSKDAKSKDVKSKDVKDAKTKDAKSKDAKGLTLKVVAALSENERSDLFDKLLDSYCLICGGMLDKSGECPKGCEVEEQGDEDEEDEEDA
jgi:hypothetical protein